MTLRKRTSRHDCPQCREFSRRKFLASSSAGAAAMIAAPAWLPKIAVRKGPATPGRDVFVNIYQRGGSDGLTFVPRIDSNGVDGEWDLAQAARPSLNIPLPGQPNGAIPLTAEYGLAPAAAGGQSAPTFNGLMTPWNDGRLAIAHAAGSHDPTRSHFDAQNSWEFGTPGQPKGTASSGWLARHLQITPACGTGPLRGMAVSALMPKALAQAPLTIPVPNPSNYNLPGDPNTAAERRTTIEAMYDDEKPPVGTSALTTFGTMDMLAQIGFDGYMPEHGAVYPQTPFGNSMRMTAAVIKADEGVECVEVDIGGWDLHNQMGPHDPGGDMYDLMEQVGLTFEAFYLDLGQHLSPPSWNVTTFMQSEFGRRVAQNASGGTDHGHGNAIFVMGGAVNGGIYSNWPGLDPASLNDGDLEVTLDYRDILTEIMALRLSNTNWPYVFPNFTPGPRPGIVS